MRYCDVWKHLFIPPFVPGYDLFGIAPFSHSSHILHLKVYILKTWSFTRSAISDQYMHHSMLTTLRTFFQYGPQTPQELLGVRCHRHWYNWDGICLLNVRGIPDKPAWCDAQRPLDRGVPRATGPQSADMYPVRSYDEVPRLRLRGREQVHRFGDQGCTRGLVLLWEVQITPVQNWGQFKFAPHPRRKILDMHLLLLVAAKFLLWLETDITTHS